MRPLRLGTRRCTTAESNGCETDARRGRKHNKKKTHPRETINEGLLPVDVLGLGGGRVVVVGQHGGLEAGKVVDLHPPVATAQRHALALHKYESGTSKHQQAEELMGYLGIKPYFVDGPLSRRLGDRQLVVCDLQWRVRECLWWQDTA